MLDHHQTFRKHVDVVDGERQIIYVLHVYLFKSIFYPLVEKIFVKTGTAEPPTSDKLEQRQNVAEVKISI